ncbi:hypothetical protein P4603_26245 [Priestia aryabhattai]|uniref:hypothetical protein n=1 Tax=Priestia aryabhattai TaxID=412384 RepID=UPI002E1DFFEF|nr:hypothetical protein [Priestia aryabhattai]
MKVHKSPDYRRNMCRFSRVEDTIQDLMMLIRDEESLAIIKKYHKKLVKEEKEKVEARLNQTKQKK